MKSESTDDLDREFPTREDDVVESNEERPNVVRLSEMAVKLLGEVLKDSLTDSSLCEGQTERVRTSQEGEAKKSSTDQDRRWRRSKASRALR